MTLLRNNKEILFFFLSFSFFIFSLGISASAMTQEGTTVADPVAPEQAEVQQEQAPEQQEVQTGDDQEVQSEEVIEQKNEESVNDTASEGGSTQSTVVNGENANASAQGDDANSSVEKQTESIEVSTVISVTCDRSADLSGSIVDGNSIEITNTSDNCAYEVGLASYEKIDESYDTQTLFDSQTDTVDPNSSIILTVDVPTCAYQIDAFYGDLIENLGQTRDGLYGERKIDFGHYNGSNYCIDEEPEPTPELATITAHKIVCDDEADLPNWGITSIPSQITADTAEAYVASHSGCHLESGWKFEWALPGTPDLPGDLIGEAGGAWNTAPQATDANGKTTFTIDVAAHNNPAFVWVREVQKVGYIPFTYEPGHPSNEDTVSAEMYCNVDIVNFDNFDRVDNLEAGESFNCVAFNVLEEEPEPQPESSITLIAHKIVCDDEADLPNWGADGDIPVEGITKDTATDFVAAHSGCHFEANWDFQWAPTGVGEPTTPLYGELGAPWTTFDQSTDANGMAMTTIDFGSEGVPYIVWVREVLKDGYLPFSYGNNKQTPEPDNVSPEMYCTTDVERYDNFDRAEKLEAGETYYCVAFNVLEEKIGQCTEPEFTSSDTLTVEIGEALSYTLTASSTSATTFTVATSSLPDGLTFDGIDTISGTTTTAGTFTVDITLTNTCEEVNTTVSIVVSDNGGQGGNPGDGGNGGGGNNDDNDDNNGGGSASGGGFFRGGSSNGGGQVLGATTVPGVCTPLLTDYLRIGQENDPTQVRLLQAFLKGVEGYDVDVTGFFDQKTDTAVRAFQVRYADDVLAPWGITESTGYVFYTTQKKINEIYCERDFPLTPQQAEKIEMCRIMHLEDQFGIGGSQEGDVLGASSDNGSTGQIGQATSTAVTLTLNTADDERDTLDTEANTPDTLIAEAKGGKAEDSGSFINEAQDRLREVAVAAFAFPQTPRDVVFYVLWLVLILALVYILGSLIAGIRDAHNLSTIQLRMRKIVYFMVGSLIGLVVVVVLDLIALIVPLIIVIIILSLALLYYSRKTI